MKTFRINRPLYPQLLIRLMVISIIAVVLILFSANQLTAKGTGTLTGYVVDEEFNEPLEKAVVTIPGTLISVITDQLGMFTMKLVGGNYSLEVNFPGHQPKRYNISVSEGIATPMFIIKLKSNYVARTLQRRISSYENKRRFPQNTDNFSIWQITEQVVNQEFNQMLTTIPSASYLSYGNGYNDSRVGFRGNDPAKTTYTLNGILLNNPENGSVGSSILSGLTDWAGQIQVVTGQAANLQSQSGYGGLVNVHSLVSRQKAGADLLAVYGNQGLLKTSATAYTGLSKKGLATTIQISRTSGNGLVQNTAFEQYGFFIDIHKEFNRLHSLILSLNGTFQQHDQNASDSIGAYSIYGINYNKHWGTLNEKPLSWSTNYGRSPLVNLTHVWQYRIKTQVKSQLYAQFNRTAQLKPGGFFNNQTFNQAPRDTAGQVLFGKITDWNKGLTVPEMGAVRSVESDGAFINSENSGISTLVSIDRENRFGLRSVVTREFSKELDGSVSFDLNEYKASHFGAVNNLLGANSYSSLSDINRPDGYSVDQLFQPKLFSSFNSPGKAGYFYESGIQSGGLSMRVNYHAQRFFWYAEGSASLQNMQRTDHFNYLSTDPQRKAKSSLLPGGRIQSGFSFHFWKYHSIHLKANYGSYQPLFTVLFPAGNNWKNNATNEKVFDSEFGYSIIGRKLKIEALAYWSQIANRSTVRYSNLNSSDLYGLINGLSELHQGIELKTSYKITGNFTINVNGSLGDWKYSKDGKAEIYDTKNQMTATNDLLIKDVMIANAPQLRYFAEAEWRWAHNFYIRMNYSKTDRIYAPFGLYDFKDIANRSDFNQWKLPAYETIGASGNYLLKMGKTQTLNFFFGAQNLLDTEYFEQSATNFIESDQRFTSNQVYYGIGRTWFAGVKLQF